MGKSHRSSSRSSSVSSTDAHRRSRRDKSDLERRLRHLERKVRKSRHARKHHTRRSRSTTLSPRHTHERGERTSPLHSSKESEGFDRGTFSRCPTPISLPTNGGEPETADVLVCLEPDLEKEVLALLGDDPSEKSEEIHLHEALTVRWNYNLTRGLDAQVKTALLGKYQTPINCELLKAPEINPEILPALADIQIKKDKYQRLAQSQLGVGLTSLGEALTLLLKESGSRNEELLKLLIDSGKILTDLFFNMSRSRRANIAQNLNKSMKDIIQKDTPGHFLFGEDLSERIKSAKTLQKSSQDLKAVPDKLIVKTPKISQKRGGGGTTNYPSTSRSLNSRSSFRSTRDLKQKGRDPRPYQSYKNYRSRSPSRPNKR
ncbi:uncharacterized protein LOC107397419 [Tribolium castaneum]|uniref:uncharacterized protein LOC107397419 n=1 Tax=Tribolium castaneum TaxID=7070 RepID=UPI0030FEDE38